MKVIVIWGRSEAPLRSEQEKFGAESEVEIDPVVG